MTFNRDVAGFVIALYIKDLANWSDEGYDENLAAARQLADDLGVRKAVDHELDTLGWTESKEKTR